jgi:hypothetical protein
MSMDEWRLQQQQHRLASGGVGPIHNYHSIRSRSSPYPSTHQMSDMKQSYQYPQNSSSNPLSPSPATTPNANSSTTPVSVKNDSNDTTSSSSEDMSTTNSNPVCFQLIFSVKSIICFLGYLYSQ